MTDTALEDRTLSFTILGRTLKHFGVQMYKRRDAAIAELVSNGFDAKAKLCEIVIPEPSGYDRMHSSIEIADNGSGMAFDQIQSEYLVLGRNRRLHDREIDQERPVMGRKGIGKLAGFGLGREMVVTTWRTPEEVISFTLASEQLDADDGDARDVSIPWSMLEAAPRSWPSGTVVVVRGLKHSTAISHDSLARSLARRFSRRTKSVMLIKVNGTPLPDATPTLEKRFPEDPTAMLSHTLRDGQVVKYWYGFAESVIPTRELRGFSILVSGKIAQAPPFFFDVEATASGQHSTKYVIGEIEADYLDAGIDNDSDRISTDRQELDWEDDFLGPLLEWGRALSRKVLSECRDFRGERTEREVLQDADLRARVEALDRPSQSQLRKVLRMLEWSTEEGTRTKDLASALIRAYEFRAFHDVIEQIDALEQADDADGMTEFLGRLYDWQVLEGRALLEVIKGRVSIIDRLQAMIVNNAPETAHRTGDDNLHDLLGRFPWLLNPDWQVLAEERTVEGWLRQWFDADNAGEGGADRFDFVALGGEQTYVIIEIKRPDHAVSLDEAQRAVRYAEKLRKSTGKEVHCVMIAGTVVDVSSDTWEMFIRSRFFEFRPWSQLLDKTKAIYDRYRAFLDDSSGPLHLAQMQREVASTRSVIQANSAFRGPSVRREGLGGQDLEFNTGTAPSD